MRSTHLLAIVVTVCTLALALAEGQEPRSVEFYADQSDLKAYVETALQKHPALLESWARYRSAWQKIPQATAMPDPAFTYTQSLRSVETRVGPQYNTFSLSQKFPWFGKLDLKGQTLAKAAVGRFQLFRAQEREVIHQVKQSFYDLIYLDWADRITREELLLLEHYEQLAQSRYGTGRGRQQDVIKIQAELTRVLNKLEILNQQRQSAAAQLNSLMDRRPEETVPLTSEPDLPLVELDLDGLYELGTRNRHELKAVNAFIEKTEKQIELAKKDFWPDFSLSAGFINVGDRNDPPGLLLPPLDNGKNAYNISVGLNIPIWRDKYRAGVLEATENLIAEKQNYMNIRNSMEFSVRDQVIRIEALRSQIELLNRALIPQAEQALQSSESAYETGQARALDLLDSERLLLESRLIKARYFTDYLKALASLERAIGTKFPG